MRTAALAIMTASTMWSLITPAIARVSPFTAGATNAGSATGWTYTLINNDSTGNIRALALYLVWDSQWSPGTPFRIDESPQGWHDDSLPDDFSYCVWWSIGSDEPLPGKSLGGFTINSSIPLPLFSVTYYNQEYPADQITTDPELVTLVSEPNAVPLLLTGFALLAREFRRVCPGPIPNRHRPDLDSFWERK